MKAMIDLPMDGSLTQITSLVTPFEGGGEVYALWNRFGHNELLEYKVTCVEHPNGIVIMSNTTKSDYFVVSIERNGSVSVKAPSKFKDHTMRIYIG